MFYRFLLFLRNIIGSKSYPYTKSYKKRLSKKRQKAYLVEQLSIKKSTQKSLISHAKNTYITNHKRLHLKPQHHHSLTQNLQQWIKKISKWHTSLKNNHTTLQKSNISKITLQRLHSDQYQKIFRQTNISQHTTKIKKIRPTRIKNQQNIWSQSMVSSSFIQENHIQRTTQKQSSTSQKYVIQNFIQEFKESLPTKIREEITTILGEKKITEMILSKEERSILKDLLDLKIKLTHT